MLLFAMPRPAIRPFHSLHDATIVDDVATSFATPTHRTAYLLIRMPIITQLEHIPELATIAIQNIVAGKLPDRAGQTVRTLRQKERSVSGVWNRGHPQ